MTSSVNKSAVQNVPTLHHLNDSQSQRILWLLEELNIEYDLKLYARDTKKLRAPSSLSEISSLGKSPVLVTADDRVITESSAIIAYLLKTYDKENSTEKTDWIQDEILTSFAGATLGPIITIELFLDLAHKKSPWPIGWFVGKLRKLIHDNFTGIELRKDLSWLENELAVAKWFGGNKLSRADILISWPLDLIVTRKWINLSDEYPKLGEWRQRILNRPAWRRGIEKGNGYDLSKW